MFTVLLFIVEFILASFNGVNTYSHEFTRKKQLLATIAYISEASSSFNAVFLKRVTHTKPIIATPMAIMPSGKD